MINEGKKFEQDFSSSFSDEYWVYRLRDNAASFGNNCNTRFTSSNICDYIILHDSSKTLYLLEMKSTKSNSMSLSMIRENQIQGLINASDHRLFAGFVCNFRNENNDTFFIQINDFVNMMENINKKSFNINDLIKNNAIRIRSKKKRTRYIYDVDNFVCNLHL